MSGLFGGGKVATPAQPPAIGAIQVQQSVYGATLSLIYGQTRVPPNLIWYDDFLAVAHISQQASGGKGGGGTTTSTTTYTYQAAIALALGEGVISNIPTVWSGKSVYTGAAGGATLWANEGYTVGGSLQYTVVNAGSFTDNGVVQVMHYDPISGQQVYTPLEQVLDAPGPLQYSFSAAGVYTFNVADTGTDVYINYSYYAIAPGNAIAQVGMSLFTGSNPQTPWGYLTTAHPGKDLGYQGTAYVAGAVVQLDNAGALPAFNFEVVAQLQYGGGVLDCNPKAVVYDFLTNAFYGAGWGTTWFGDLTQFSNYCVANGIFISPAYTSQASAASMLTDLLDIANCAPVFSEGVLKIIPYGDETVTGHGVTYTPVSTVQYNLNDSDYIVSNPGDDPILCTRGNPADAFNSVTVEFMNRANQYNKEPVEAHDSANVAMYGLRQQSTATRPQICDLAVARGHAQRKLQRGLYIRNVYAFTLGWRYFLLEPMDIVTLTDAAIGLSLAPVRILTIEEDQDGNLAVTAEEFPGQVATNAVYPAQPVDPYTVNYAVSPGAANTPVIFGGPLDFTQGALEVWIATSGSDINYGGCEIWVSNDGDSYTKRGQINGNNRMGVTTSILPLVVDPDTSSSLGVNITMSQGALDSATQAQADNGYSTLCYVDGELVQYRDATLTSAYHYNLSYLRRGQHGTTPKAHASGTDFVRVDGLTRVSVTQTDINMGIYVKCRAFNKYGGGLQDLADVAANFFNVTAADAPSMPAVSGLELFGQGNNTSFTGRDAKFAWRTTSSNSFDVGSEPYGGNSGAQANFRDYEVRVLTVSGVLLRTEHTTDVFYTYTYEHNFEDSNGVPNRSFTVQVYLRGQQGQLSVIPAQITVSNPAPAAPSGLFCTPMPGNVVLGATIPSLTDLAGMEIWQSTSSGFTPGSGNKVYQGPNNTYSTPPMAPGTALYFRVAFYDTFSSDPATLNLSTEVSATPIRVGIQAVSSLPVSGMLTGDVVYLNGDKKLYRYDSATWVTWVDGSDILASSVTAGKISVIDLSAITASLGAITSGIITLDSSSYIRGGQSAYNTGTGFFLGYSSGAYKFSLGTAGGSGLTFDGSTLTVTGDIVTAGQVKATGSTGSFDSYIGVSAMAGDASGISGHTGVGGKASGGTGVQGVTDTSVGTGGTATGAGGIGVSGVALGSASGAGYGVKGYSSYSHGVYGEAITSGKAGVVGVASGGASYGVFSSGPMATSGSLNVGGVTTNSGAGLDIGTSVSISATAGNNYAIPAGCNGFLSIYLAGTLLKIPCFTP